MCAAKLEHVWPESYKVVLTKDEMDMARRTHNPFNGGFHNYLRKIAKHKFAAVSSFCEVCHLSRQGLKEHPGMSGFPAWGDE